LAERDCDLAELSAEALPPDLALPLTLPDIADAVKFVERVVKLVYVQNVQDNGGGQEG
jgi:hypothetical protein